MLTSYFGNMMCGKTEKLIQILQAYKKLGFATRVLVPLKCKNRVKFFPSQNPDVLQSRANLEVQVDFYIDETDKNEWKLVFDKLLLENEQMVLFIDEVNQMDKEFIFFLENFCKTNQIKAYCFGLKKDCFKKMYASSQALFETSNHIFILSKTCDLCKKNLSEYDLTDTTDINSLINAKYFQICFNCEKNGLFSSNFEKLVQ